MIRKTNLAILVVLLGSTLALAVTTQAPAAKAATSALPDVVKIGFMYPATGGLAVFGDGMLSGAIAAAYRANQTYDFKVQLVIGDSASGDKTTAKSEAQKLLNDGVQVVVGAAASSSTLAISEIFAPAQVPVISYASTSPAITDLDDNGYVFRVVASDAFQGKALAQLVYDKKGITKVIVVNRDDAYGNGIADEFTAAFEAKGGTVENRFKYSAEGVTNFNFDTELTAIQESDAPGVVLIAFGDDGQQFFAQAKARNIQKTWFGADGIASEGLVGDTTIKDYVNGTLFGTAPAAGGDITSGETKYDQYLADLKAVNTSGNLPTSDGYTHIDIFGDYAYDAVLLAAAAIADANDYDGPAIKDSIYKLTGGDGFLGATGVKKFNCAGDPIAQPYIYWKADNGKLTPEEVVVFDSGEAPCVTAGEGGGGEEESGAIPGFEFMAVLPMLLLGASSALLFRRRRRQE